MKAIVPGSEVDAWCTKCKLDLGHRIIAMEGPRIARVECLTCRGHHNYRRPRSEEAPAAVRKRKNDGAPKSTAGTRRPPKKTELRQIWEEAIVGKQAGDFVAYRIDVELAPGQLVRHKKFGDGVVSELIEGGKVQVVFQDGPRTLIHGRV